MKKLLIGALCIMASCQSKPTENHSYQKTGILVVSTPEKLIDTILTDVWVHDYKKKTFIVATAKVKLWGEDCDNKKYFYNLHHNTSNEYTLWGENEYERIKIEKQYVLLTSKPISANKVKKEQYRQYNICLKYDDSIRVVQQNKNKLDSIADHLSKPQNNSLNIIKPLKQKYEIGKTYWNNGVTFTVGYALPNLTTGSYNISFSDETITAL